MGMFHPFVDDAEVEIRLIGVEAAGDGVDTKAPRCELCPTAVALACCMATRSYLLQDGDGQIIEAHSIISAGLDYPGIGPEHAWLHETGRAEYVAITDDEALASFQLCSRLEGIIPALECAHALAYVEKLAPTMRPDQIILMNLSGRGDKDIFTVAEHLGARL